MRIAGLTDVGRVRARNEDAMDWDETAGVVVVADGMGGHPAGDVASALAVRTIMERVHTEAGSRRWLDGGGNPESAIEAANTAIQLDAQRHPERQGMGTTVVVLAMGDGHCRVAHVGDSRAYLFREGTLSQVTHDHTAAQQALDHELLTPEQARHSPERHQLTRALGLEAAVTVDVKDVTCDRGDLFLLCSDGLTEMVEPESIRAVLEDNTHDPERAARLLIRLAMNHGGHDNCTVAVVAV